MNQNPLLQPFNTPFQSVPFDQIRQEDYREAIIQAIETARQEIAAISNNPETPTFDNTLVTREEAGRQLAVASEAFFNLNSAETSDYLQEVAEEISPLLAAFSNDINLDEALFARVKHVYEQADRTGFSTEMQRLLDKSYKHFTRNGALLSEADKQTLRQIDQELSGLTVKFSQNVLQETNAYSMHIEDEAGLEGLPASIVAQARAEAETRSLTGWVFTLQFPSYVPFLKYAANRERRKELYLASAQKAFKDNAYNNEAIIKKIVSLRDQRARLLGFASHAAFVLEERMAGTPDAVTGFLNDLLEKARPFAHQDVASLQPLAARDGLTELMPYDHAYYAEKLREEKYDYSEEALKPYFPLQQVLQAAFAAAGKLYGLSFSERTDIPTYHEEVTVYEVLEEGRHKALLYTDWHPRKGKRAGAWMTSFKGQYRNADGEHRPHISIVCNFSRPTGDTPSLLTFNEVTTLFHEFGHALHGMLADTRYESLSGTNVYWDFVELPSQFMENFCYQKEFLATFAHHYKTGELLPEAQIDKIVASANFMEGYQTLRQLAFGLLDMAYHTGGLAEQDTIEHFEKEITRSAQLYPALPHTAQSPSFSHIFAGGYSAGYYSYKWSEVLDADAFAYFKETGIFNPETAALFKTLLSKGGTEDPMDLYVAFRGRKPEVNALLQRAGLN
ncbi:M3 family metallopeptidase [Taibaiella chishuiensis]|uniref:Peptidyl-dipeptidase Dcp n=1 Tax=Taibaiella chishuiensis TaxID=1434707 RepID=A0A2P8CXC6_9BACT|nr:M3 family metallopeptidase [Taibaiella chishuiensis]PSK89599.1 peptidyl-dipeptidase Dcp [Taibaiella chishuiensis]